MPERSAHSVDAVAFDLLGVVAKERMAFDGPSPVEYVLDDGVLEEISNLRKFGIRVGLVSNNDRISTLESPLGPRLAELFDALIFASDVSNPKPHPDMFKEVLLRLHVEPQRCAFIDDLARNCDTADLLGMPSHVALSSEDVVAYCQSLYR